MLPRLVHRRPRSLGSELVLVVLVELLFAEHLAGP